MGEERKRGHLAAYAYLDGPVRWQVSFFQGGKERGLDFAVVTKTEREQVAIAASAAYGARPRPLGD